MTTANLAKDGIDLRVFLNRLWHKRWWIFTSTLLFTVAATAAAFLMTPIYRASTVMVSAGADRSSVGSLSSALGQLGGLASLAGIGVGSGDLETEEALAVLRSRRFTRNFISGRNLMPKLFAREWNAALSKWNVRETDRPTPAEAYKYFDQKIRKVNQDKKTGLVTLQIDWKDRNEAAEWSNELVERINAEMRARAIAKAEASIGFLQKELTNTADVGTREAVNRLIESQVKRRMLASVMQEYAFRVVDRAMPPDAKDPVRPRKVIFVLLGLVLGLSIGCMAVLIVVELKRYENPDVV